MLSDVSTSQETRPKQARSVARRQVLLEHGVDLFNAKGLDDVSIQEITQAVGFSTGSFYSYFTDKTDYFVAVQTWVAKQLKEKIDAAFAQIDRNASLPNRLEVCVEFALKFFRSHTGLVHAALSYERRVPEGWKPHRATTTIIIGRAVLGLPNGPARQLEIAIQLAFGLLVNSVLHDPGPLRLQDADLAEHIMTALTPYLGEDQVT